MAAMRPLAILVLLFTSFSTLVSSYSPNGRCGVQHGNARCSLEQGCCSANAQMNVLDSNTTTFGWLILNLPMSAGIGSLFTSLSMATQASAEHRTAADDSFSLEQKMKIRAIAAG
jgi:hypothetical protein